MAFTNLFTVNTFMIPAKVISLISGLHFGSYLSFLNVFFVSVGLSKFQAGLITGLIFGPPVIAGPLWGYIADYTKRRKLVLVLLCLGASLPVFSMPWIAHGIYPQSHYKCNDTNTTNQWTRSSFDCETSRQEAINSLFKVLLALMLIGSVFLIPLPGYIDAIVINVVKSSPNKATFGGQKIFYSIGISLGNFVAGKASDHYHHTDMSPYTAAFIFILPYSLLMIPVGCYLMGQVDVVDATQSSCEEKNDVVCESNIQEDINVKNSVNSEFLYMQVVRLLSRFEVLFLMATVFVSGLANSLFLNFSYMLVTDEMKKSKAEMTLVIIVATVSETLFFPFASDIIKTLGGTKPAIILGTFAHFVRFLVMWFNIPFVLLVCTQALSSFAFALSFSAFIEEVHVISPKEINVTMNTFMVTIFGSVSAFVANILGGKIYELYGGRTLFLGQSIICLFWIFVMVTYHGIKILKTYCATQKSDAEIPGHRKCNESVNGIENMNYKL